MIKKLIKQYINKLTKQDIVDFALKQGIILTDKELEVIYNEIKYNFDELFYNTECVLNKRKDKLEHTTYLKIKELILIYKEKYRNYL